MMRGLHGHRHPQALQLKGGPCFLCFSVEIVREENAADCPPTRFHQFTYAATIVSDFPDPAAVATLLARYELHSS